ncbi:RNA methyltransferase [Desulfogranum mediterraneum]|uniref:RNA methyltransferase n=1 Tax=Desulfogranum mediterraneum TaxID=160661 RepID=UPI00041A0B64|nr:RNA methyltransferase [Desulfogranum mediterraneum]
MMNHHDKTPARTAIILVHPKYPENIGASARIAYNFGISELIVVSDRPPDQERMLKMATHKAAHLIHNMRLCATTAEAAQPFHCIVATTARQGRHRPQELSPRQVMTEVAPLAGQQHLALMFGPENTGLTNEDVDLCQYSSTIPTDDFSSLNLAQAVAIHCYELYTASPQRLTADRTQEYANSFDLEGMYEHIEEALTRVTFLHETNRIYWMRNIRQFLSRIRLRKKEASMIRGICRKFLWHSDQEVKGKQAGENPQPRD